MLHYHQYCNQSHYMYISLSCAVNNFYGTEIEIWAGIVQVQVQILKIRKARNNFIGNMCFALKLETKQKARRANQRYNIEFRNFEVSYRLIVQILENHILHNGAKFVINSHSNRYSAFQKFYCQNNFGKLLVNTSFDAISKMFFYPIVLHLPSFQYKQTL